MKPSTRNLLIALGLFAGFVTAYRLAEPAGQPVVTTEQARRLPAVIPPQPKVDEEERRAREAHQDRLIEILNQEIRELNARRREGAGDVMLRPLPPDHPDDYLNRISAEPAKPDPARPVGPLEKGD